MALDSTNLKILIVEDDVDTCELYKEFLQDFAATNNMIFANDGSTALLKIQNQEFDIIFLDLNLPKLDGIGLLRTLAEDKPQWLIKIIVVSGELDQEKLQEAITLGIKKFIVKPFTAQDLIESFSYRGLKSTQR